jgi:two-component SAPR family response regulator
MLKARYSEDDFHNATLLKRVAEMYARQGRYGDAEPFERRSLAVDEHMFGADNFLISNSLLRLADTHRLLNEADAEALYKRALVIHEKTLGSEHGRLAAC